MKAIPIRDNRDGAGKPFRTPKTLRRSRLNMARCRMTQQSNGLPSGTGWLRRENSFAYGNRESCR
jgi:hypothetical protein